MDMITHGQFIRKGDTEYFLLSELGLRLTEVKWFFLYLSKINISADLVLLSIFSFLF